MTNLPSFSDLRVGDKFEYDLFAVGKIRNFVPVASALPPWHELRAGDSFVNRSTGTRWTIERMDVYMADLTAADGRPGAMFAQHWSGKHRADFKRAESPQVAAAPKPSYDNVLTDHNAPGGIVIPETTVEMLMAARNLEYCRRQEAEKAAILAEWRRPVDANRNGLCVMKNRYEP